MAKSKDNINLLAQQIIKAKESTGKPFAVLLGSGASLAPEHPAMKTMVAAVAEVEMGDSVSRKDWLAACDAFFARLSAVTDAKGRNKLLEKHLDQIIEAEGYRALAQLVAEGHIGLVLTTNFDTLIERALEDELGPGYRKLIIGRDTPGTISSKLQNMDQPTVIKLCGDMPSRLFAFSPTERQDAAEAFHQVPLDTICSGVIVVGWLPIDDIWLEPAASLPGPFWFVHQLRPEGVVLNHMRKKEKRLYGYPEHFVEGIYGQFDSFFKTLYGHLMEEDINRSGAISGEDVRKEVTALSDRLAKLGQQIATRRLQLRRSASLASRRFARELEPISARIDSVQSELQKESLRFRFAGMMPAAAARLTPGLAEGVRAVERRLAAVDLAIRNEQELSAELDKFARGEPLFSVPAAPGREQFIQQAKDRLRGSSVLQIAGEPGSGRTATAKALAAELAKDGAFTWTLLTEILPGDDFNCVTMRMRAQLLELGETGFEIACNDARLTLHEIGLALVNTLKTIPVLWILDGLENLVDDGRFPDRRVQTFLRTLCEENVNRSRFIWISHRRLPLGTGARLEFLVHPGLGQEPAQALLREFPALSEVSENQLNDLIRWTNGSPRLLRWIGHWATTIAPASPLEQEEVIRDPQQLLEQVTTALTADERAILQVFAPFRLPVPWAATGLSQHEPVGALVKAGLLAEDAPGLWHGIAPVRQLVFSALDETAARKLHRSAARYYRSVAGSPHFAMFAAAGLEALIHQTHAGDRIERIPRSLSNKLQQNARDLYAARNMGPAQKYFQLILDLNPHHTDAHFNLAVIASRDNDRDPSVERHFLAALEREPDNVRFCHGLANHYRKLDDFEKASELYERALAVNPDGTAIYLSYAQMEMNHGDLDRARAILDRAIERQPANLELLDVYASMELGSGHTLRAINILERTAATPEPPLNSLVTLASIQWDLGQHTEAVAVLRRGLEVHPRATRLLRQLSSYLADIGQLSDARQIVQRGLELLPRDPVLTFDDAIFAWQAGDLDTARTQLSRLIKAKRPERKAALALAILEWKAGNLTAAADAFRRGLKLDPRNQTLLINAALFEDTRGNLKEALDFARRASRSAQGSRRLAKLRDSIKNRLEVRQRIDESAASASANQTDASILRKHARLLLDNGYDNEARAILRQIIPLTDDPGSVRKELFRLGLKANSPEAEVRADMAEALEADAEDVDLLCQAARYLASVKAPPEETEHLFRKALELKPDHYDSVRFYANWLKEQGRPEDAEAYYIQGVQLRPFEALAQNNLGLFYQDLGLIERAETCFRKAIDVTPGFAWPYLSLSEVLIARHQTEEAPKLIFRAVNQFYASRDMANTARALDVLSGLRNEPGVDPLIPWQAAITAAGLWLLAELNNMNHLHRCRTRILHLVPGQDLQLTAASWILLAHLCGLLTNSNIPFQRCADRAATDKVKTLILSLPDAPDMDKDQRDGFRKELEAIATTPLDQVAIQVLLHLLWRHRDIQAAMEFPQSFP